MQKLVRKEEEVVNGRSQVQVPRFAYNISEGKVWYPLLPPPSFIVLWALEQGPQPSSCSLGTLDSSPLLYICDRKKGRVNFPTWD